jgi:hypothetical protein
VCCDAIDWTTIDEPIYLSTSLERIFVIGMQKVTLLTSSRTLDGFNGHSGAVFYQALVANSPNVLRVVFAYRERRQRAMGTVVGTARSAVLQGADFIEVAY